MTHFTGRLNHQPLGEVAMVIVISHSLLSHVLMDANNIPSPNTLFINITKQPEPPASRLVIQTASCLAATSKRVRNILFLSALLANQIGAAEDGQHGDAGAKRSILVAGLTVVR